MFGGLGEQRSHNFPVKSRVLCQLSYESRILLNSLVDPVGLEPTPFGLKGRCATFTLRIRYLTIAI